MSISPDDVQKTETWNRIHGRLTNKNCDKRDRIEDSDVDDLLSELTCLAEQYAVPWRGET